MKNNLNYNKLALFTDLHLGISKNSQVFIDIINNYIEWFLKQCDNNDIEAIIFMGDWFNDRTSINVKTLNESKDIIKKITKKYPLYLIIGNHDIYYKDRIDINSVRIFDDIENLHVIYEPTKYINTELSKSLYLCPWGTNIKDIKETYDYMFGHFEFNGARLYGSNSIGADVNISDFNMSELIFSGHYHIRDTYKLNDKNTLITVGSPYEQTWGDIDNKRGFYILDVNKNKYEFIENTISPKHYKIYYSKLKNKTQTLSKQLISNNFIKLIIDCKYKFNDIVKLITLINSHNPIEVKTEYIYNSFKSINKSIEKNINTNISTEEYIYKYAKELLNTEEYNNIKYNDIEELIKHYINESLDDTDIITNKSNVIFKQIEIQNFKSIGPKITFNFERHTGLNFICGNNLDIPGLANGCGKTTLLMDSVMFIIYGKTINDINNKDIVNKFYMDKKQDCNITLHLSKNNDEYLINFYMKYRGTSPKLFLYKIIDKNKELIEENLEDITKSTINETRKYIINEIIGCSQNLFKSSILLSFSGANNFFQMTKQQKRDYIEQSFELTIFGKILKNVRSDLNNIDKEILENQRELKKDEYNLAEYNKKDSEFNVNKVNALKTLKNKILNLKKEINDSKVKFTNEEQNILSKGIIDNKKYIDFKEQLNKLLIEQTMTYNSEKEKEKQLINFNSKYQILLDKICDTCNTKIKQDFKLDDLDLNKQKCIKNNILKIKNKEKIVFSKINDINVHNNKYEKLKNKKNEINIENKYKIEQLKLLVEQFNNKKSEQSQFKDLIKKTTENIDNIKNILDNFIIKKNQYKVIENIVSEDGAKKYIIKDLVNLLNDLIGNYLSEMGSNYTCIFDTNFECEFITQNGYFNYKNFSAGEAKRIDISILFAFRDLLQSNSLLTNICVIDELIDSNVDTYAIESIVKILKKQTINKNQTIYLTSHREGLTLYDFDNIIELQKENGITTIVKDEQGGI